jgi:hypothetical protein
MADEKQTQLSQPKKGKPIEIPVPKREDFESLVTKAAQLEKRSDTA